MEFDLDEINNGRVETTKKRVAHAILLLTPIEDAIKQFDKNGNQPEESQIQTWQKTLGKAISLLEAGNEELNWACEHFKWNDEICMQIDNAIKHLGQAAASLIYETNEDDFVFTVGFGVEEALVLLSKAVGTLMHWFDDDVRIEDV